jgi:hypothetical protein
LQPFDLGGAKVIISMKLGILIYYIYFRHNNMPDFTAFCVRAQYFFYKKEENFDQKQ